ncbi:MAG: hydroxymethylbilane synthase, partial [Alphaproteobacteria bacterium]|nr:hydroxymethylbilane synthase [Alphaproteobacteria bacterium]MDA8010111.1 hydroxymethylbilane synthase [Alphaproteobacteria bacterium]
RPRPRNMNTNTITVAARASRLARAQAAEVIRKLRSTAPDKNFRFIPAHTRGDQKNESDNIPLKTLGGKGAFTDTINTALRNGHCRLAVHSLKDIPAADTDTGIILAATPARADPRDTLVCRADTAASLKDLAPGAAVGTSSPRRAAWLQHLRPDLQITATRGNVTTRLRRLAAGKMDALILAAAGLQRLDRLPPDTPDGEPRRLAVPEGEESLAPLDAAPLPSAEFLPAACQGTLAVCVAAADPEALALAQTLQDDKTRRCAEIERAVLLGLGGDCDTPCGVFARFAAAADPAAPPSLALDAWFQGADDLVRETRTLKADADLAAHLEAAFGVGEILRRRGGLVG